MRPVDRGELSARTSHLIEQLSGIGSDDEEVKLAVAGMRDDLESILARINTDALPPVGTRRIASVDLAGLLPESARGVGQELVALNDLYEHGFDPDVDQEFELSYTTDELAAVRLLAGWALLDESDEPQAGDATAGVASLIERHGLVEDENGDPVLTEPHATVLAAAADPALQIVVERHVLGVIEMRVFHVTEPLAVVQERLPDGGVVLTPMDPEQVLQQVALYGRLVWRDDPARDDASPVELDADVLEQLLTSDHQPLREQGIVERKAEPFVTALELGRTRMRVSVAYEAEPTADAVLTVSSVAWIDAGQGGLWVPDPIDADPDGDRPIRYRLSLVSPLDVVGRIEALIPDDAVA